MALEIKAIPTLYGEEAQRFRKMAEESERNFDTCTEQPPVIRLCKIY